MRPDHKVYWAETAKTKMLYIQGWEVIPLESSLLYIINQLRVLTRQIIIRSNIDTVSSAASSVLFYALFVTEYVYHVFFPSTFS
jgi:hypothetical protein